jgi:hypothetical protein
MRIIGRCSRGRLPAQDAEALVLSDGITSSELPVLVECLARCGDAKHDIA